MKKVLAAILVFFALGGTAVYATHCQQHVIYPQRVVQHIEKVIVPQRVIEYVEVPNLKIIEREVYVPAKVQKQVVEKVAVQKVVVQNQRQRRQPLREAIEAVQDNLNDRANQRRAVRQAQRQKNVLVKEIVVEKQVVNQY